MPIIPIRPILIEGNVAKVTLSSGYVALVDAEDAKKVGQFNWYAMKIKRSIYAARDVRIEGKKTTILLHRFLMTAPNGLQVDHISGDGLDNRLSNLRLVTHQENCFNSRLRTQNTCGFKGVTASKRDGRWLARITHNRVMKNLGRFDTKEQAHAAYVAAAKSAFGEFSNSG